MQYSSTSTLSIFRVNLVLGPEYIENICTCNFSAFPVGMYSSTFQYFKNFFLYLNHFFLQVLSAKFCLEALFKHCSSVLHLESDEAVVSSISCPKFKFGWLNTRKKWGPNRDHNHTNQHFLHVLNDC